MSLQRLLGFALSFGLVCSLRAIPLVVVAVGDSGTIVESANSGTTWTAGTSGTTNRLRGIVHGNSSFVAVGQAGTILTSLVGNGPWTAQPSGVTETLRGIAVNGSNYVAVGGDSAAVVLTSSNATTWATVLSGIGGAGTRLRGVAFGNSVFVTVGMLGSGGGVIASSSDGTTWTTQLTPASRVDGVVFVNGTFYAVDQWGTVYTSTTGSSWATQSLSFPAWMEGLTVGPNNLIAVGAAGKAASYNGTTWTSLATGTTATLHGVAYDGAGTPGSFTLSSVFSAEPTAAHFLAIGDSGTILASPDASTWTAQTSGTTNQLSGVAAGGEVAVAVGATGTVLESTDGVSWNPGSSSFGGTLRGVAAGASNFVAVGGDTQAQAMISGDGFHWTTLTSIPGLPLRGIAWGNQTYVAVGASGTIDTITSAGVATQQVSGTSNRLDRVIWTGSEFAALDQFGTLYLSANGTAWTTESATPPAWIGGVAWNATTGVVVGASGKIRSTTTGTTWSDATSGTGVNLNGATWTGPAAALPSGDPAVFVSSIDLAIETAPTAQIVTQGGTATFSVTAGGLTPFSYQWSNSGGNIGGATSATLTLTNVQPSQADNYTVTVTNNTGGSVSSTPVALTVNVPASITTQPSAASTLYNSSTSFTVVAGGTGLTYQWMVNTGSGFAAVSNAGVYSGATTATLTLTNPPVSMSGYQYEVVATANVGSAATSNAVALTVQPGPPASITATSGTGQTATISTAYTNTLVVTVLDAGSNAVPNATVTFTAPSTGASATFAGGITTATTNASGVATAAALTANAFAGAYAIAASVPGASPNASFSLTNLKGTATVNLSGLTATYTGSAITVSSTTVPSSLNVTYTYNGLSTAPTAAGSYPIVATVNDANYVGTAAGTFVIGKATATVNLSGLNVIYTASPRSVGVTTTPNALNVGITYNASATAPTAAGSYAVVATVNDANYSGTTGGTFVIGNATATINLGALAATYDGTPKPVTVSTNPSGLATSVTYGGASTAPTAAGTYIVNVNITAPNYSGSTFSNLVISPASQTLSFTLPTTTTVGIAFPLVASATSGLPATFTIVSGNATLSGSSLILNDANPVTIQASQPGDVNHLAAPSVTQTFSASAKAAQTIAFGTLPSVTTSVAPITLTAAATSGLPITYTVTGPATVNGLVLTLLGQTGTVTVIASQPGNATYAAAPSVTQTFSVIAGASLVYFGSLNVSGASSTGTALHPDATSVGSGIAGTMSPDGKSGTLIGFVGSLNAGFVASFSVAADGSFSTTATGIVASGTPPVFGFSGKVLGRSISGTISPVGGTFSLASDPATGVSAGVAGLYTGSSIGSSTGSTYSVVGTQGEVFTLVTTPTLVTAGSGSVAANNSFNVQTAASTTVNATINPTTTTVSGTVSTASGSTVNFGGASQATAPTDRLINLSASSKVGVSAPMSVGFVIGGSTAKTVLLRAVGPSLAQFGVSGVLAHPSLTLYNAKGAVVSSNTGWGGASALSTAATQVGAFALAAGSADSALVATLNPGSYSLQAGEAVNDGGGMALAEIYDASPDPVGTSQKLVNISALGVVGSSGSVLSGGFVVTGNIPKKVLIRGVGPTLAQLGVTGPLPAPILKVFDGTGTLIAQNSAWGTPTAVNPTQSVASASDLSTAAVAVGAFPLAAGSNDAAVIVTLNPGQYSAQVSTTGASAGPALVEIYEIAP